MFPLPNSGSKILCMVSCDVLLVAKLVKGPKAFTSFMSYLSAGCW